MPRIVQYPGPGRQIIAFSTFQGRGLYLWLSTWSWFIKLTCCRSQSASYLVLQLCFETLLQCGALVTKSLKFFGPERGSRSVNLCRLVVKEVCDEQSYTLVLFALVGFVHGWTCLRTTAPISLFTYTWCERTMMIVCCGRSLDVSPSCLWTPRTRANTSVTPWCHVQNWGRSSVRWGTWTHAGLDTLSLFQCMICQFKGLWHQMTAFWSNCTSSVCDFESVYMSQVLRGSVFSHLRVWRTLQGGVTSL